MEFEARIATPLDREKISRLCVRAMGQDDYVLRILDSVIASGGLLLAFQGAELVGISNFSKNIDGTGWLGMARTDPDWRRKGVALLLQKAIAEHARKLGIRALRLFVLSTNTPSIRATLKGGFREVSDAGHVSRAIEGYLSETDDAKIPADYPLESLLGSRYLSKMNGYFGHSWSFVRADHAVLEKVRSQTYSVDDCVFIVSQPEMLEAHPHIEFALLEGSFKRGLRAAMKTCSLLGAESVGSFIPYEPYLLSIARNQGFKGDPWGWHSIVFEKKI